MYTYIYRLLYNILSKKCNKHYIIISYKIV